MAALLLIDTCGEGGGIGISADGRLLAVRDLPPRGMGEHLMDALADVLREAGCRIADLAAIAVVTGPGSFTGVRIGVAAAKGLAEAVGLPVVALSRLEMLAAQARSAGTIHAWIDAGRGDVFTGSFHPGTEPVEGMVPLAAAISQAELDTVVVMEQRLAAAFPAATLIPPVGVAQALPLALARLRAGTYADVATLDANYLRVPDAELALRARTPAA